jgi:Zn-dependent protease
MPYAGGAPLADQPTPDEVEAVAFQLRSEPARRVAHMRLLHHLAPLSVAAFLAPIAVARPDRATIEVLLGLLAIVAFHEAGHFAAMKLFGYRDVGVLFLPFAAGALAHGRPTRPGGRRDALVAICGPLPGLLLGAALMIGANLGVEILAGKPAFFAAGLLVINLANLLPLPGLDGHAFLRVLWQDRPRWALAFNVIAALLMTVIVRRHPLLLALLGGWLAWRLMEYRQSRLALELRPTIREAEADDPQSIPVDQLPRILALLKRERVFAHLTFPNSRRAARWARAIWSRACDEPVNPPSAAALLALYAACWTAIPWSVSYARHVASRRAAERLVAPIVASMTPQLAGLRARIAAVQRAAADGRPLTEGVVSFDARQAPGGGRDPEAAYRWYLQRQAAEGKDSTYRPVTSADLSRDPARYESKRVEVSGVCSGDGPEAFYLDEPPSVLVYGGWLDDAKKRYLAETLRGAAPRRLKVRGIVTRQARLSGVGTGRRAAAIQAEDVTDLGATGGF